MRPFNWFVRDISPPTCQFGLYFSEVATSAISHIGEIMKSLLDAMRYGPFYALCKAEIASPKPLNARTTWDFWSKSRSRLTMSLAEKGATGSVGHVLADHLADEHRQDIKAHYNISNDYFFLFLDEKYRFYSCGDFLSANATLEEAQEVKGRFIQSLLELRGGEQLLELGCGWGGMIKFLEINGPAQLKIDAVTISTQQASYVRSWSKANIMVADFITARFENERYDRIYSMGAWEHIPKAEIGGMYKKLYAALKPGGRFVAQFSCTRLDQLPATLLLGELFFQGFDLMSRDDQISLAEDAGFRCVHDSVHDYRPSWKAWYDRLAANETKAIELVGVKEYNRYLLLFVLAWKFIDLNYAQIHRFVFVKPE